jgi:hypothetical protein
MWPRRTFSDLLNGQIVELFVDLHDQVGLVDLD